MHIPAWGRQLRSFAMLLGWLLCAVTALGQTTQISPYLQTPSADSIWVSWKTASGTESRVDFGQAQDQLTQVVSGSVQQLGATTSITLPNSPDCGRTASTITA